MQRATAADSDRNSRSSKCLWALIAAGTRLEIPRDATKHAKSGRHAPALKLETELWCEALESGASWTCLLIPAYGKLYVKNARIIKTETRASNKHKCKLKRLVMNGAKTTSQNLRIKWIKIVGYSLDTLHLRNNTLGTRALASVLESCPRLTELDVSGCELPDVGPITRAFRDENCILRILKVAQNHISTESQEDLFRLLRDAKCASIRNLQVLHLEDNPTSRENRSLQVLLRSLQRNKTLRQVVLSMAEKHFQNAQTLRYRFDRDHNDQWLGHEDLPIQHRLAVLSIPVFKALPTAVIEIIFDYAKRDVYRHVLWD
ncbi:hypothetical protein PHMEG_0004837 [Phytophthora megakarya]|uniref:Uncharacterized protein n=1 Tax=Phytophthora megakarya TaxID=4795 RepID=A0A225WSX6_9STRA|nr:hypothetical protein PHMEG_0004837 [Phytophthora megakarya]